MMNPTLNSLRALALCLICGTLVRAEAGVPPVPSDSPPLPPGVPEKSLSNAVAHLLAPSAPQGPLVTSVPGPIGVPIPAPASAPIPGQPPVVVKQDFPNGPPLLFDATTKELQCKPEDVDAKFVFLVTNPAPYEVIVTQVRTSCGCTTAELPTLPWHIASGGTGKINVNVDLRGKHGLIQKLVSVETDHGFKTLEVKANMGEAPGTMGGQDRARNLLIATVDRQAVFKNDCATCHATPTAGKTGEALYAAACGICHDPANRASMVPELRTVNPAAVKNADYWKSWITSGKPGSLMPAFSHSFGGPLTDEQIDSLAKLLEGGIPAKKAPAHPVLPSAIPVR